MDPRYYNPLNSTTYRETTRDELQAAAYALDLEYRSEGVRIDSINIDKKLQSKLYAQKISTFAVYIPIVRKLINEENEAYIVPPQRYFMRKNSKKKLSTSTVEYLEAIYKEFDFNRKMLEFERQAAYEGTVASRPVMDRDLFYFVKLVPSDSSFEVISDARLQSQAFQMSYKTGEDEDEITHIWDPANYTIRVKEDGQDVEYSNPHGFDGVPYSVLRYESDSRRFWGPYDGGLDSFAKLRSLLLADSVHRTQVSLYEILIMSGFTYDEAAAATETRQTGKFIAYEYPKGPDGKPIPGSKDISFASPDGIESDKIFELYQKLYVHFITTRGHALKNFETGRQPQAAEAVWLGGDALRALQMSRRHPLSVQENDILKLITWENNRRASAPTTSILHNPDLQLIPEDIEVEIDWLPDPIYFTSATDKTNYYKFMLYNGLKSHADVIRLENPDLSREQAKEMFENNRKLLTEYNIGYNLTSENEEPEGSSDQ